MYLIATDEAGYGPNLGPLAVSATLWQLSEGIQPEEMAVRLAPEVVPQVSQEGLAVGDSKKLYQSHRWFSLERSVLAFLDALGKLPLPLDSEGLFAACCFPENLRERRSSPGFEGKISLPHEALLEECLQWGEKLRRKRAESGIDLLGIQSDLVFPQRWNAGVKRCGSKGVFLSQTTLQLVAGFWRQILQLEKNAQKEFSILVLCDKHGGRNRYLGTLMEHFDNLPFCIVTEGREKSEYIHYARHGTLSIRFVARGETHLAVALASMVSKYLREVAMEIFNRHWQRRIPTLRPTAGYPLDARRFRQEIAPYVQDWQGVWRDK
ncbi:MAG: hypothetical protein Q4D62_02515 [Planctomycetia bacterium]|nr:hypothetical protein [Planctomycetia bacterium]